MADSTVATDGSLTTRRTASRRVLRGLHPVIDVLLFFLLAEIIVIVFAGVIARYIFNASLSWTDELASWSLVWLTFLATAAGHGLDRHININLMGRLLTPRSATIVAFLVEAIVAFTTAMLFVGGIKLIVGIGGVSSGLGWDNRVKYLMIPVSAVLSLAFLILVRLEKGRSAGSVLMPMGAGLAFCVATLAMDEPPLAGVSPTLVMSCAFAVALFLGVPIGYAMLFSVFLSTWGANLLPIVGVVHRMVGGASAFVLLAIPFFLTAGYLMNSGGLSRRLIDFASALVGHLRGGLAQANVFHSVMLGGICGSSGADAASTTKILVPEMIRRNYSGAFSCAVTAVGSILPSCFPPSIALLIYASIAQVSVAQLFTAGIAPGLLLCALMMITVHFIATKRQYEKAPRRATVREMACSGVRAAPAMAQAVVILGLLRLGVMTATEVGIVAVLWSFIIGKFLYKSFTWAEFYRDMVDCALDSGLIMFLVAVASPFAWVMVAEQMPQQLLGSLTSILSNKWQLLLMINVIALVMGCFLEVVPSMLILVPLFLPLVATLGLDPIHLGVVIVLNLLLASVMPPIGILVFIASSIARVPSGAAFKECVPFLVTCAFGVLLITYIPGIALTLWQLLNG